MLRVGVLAKTARKNTRALVFGDASDPKTQAYKLVPFNPKKHVKTIVRLSITHQTLMAMDTPKTLDEWNRGMADFAKKEGGSYLSKWSYRSVMLAEMAAAKTTLGYHKHNTMADVQRGFPDQKGMVRSFCFRRKPGGMTVRRFTKALGYKDGLQFLTMDLCILGGAGAGVPPKTIEAAAAKIKNHRRRMDKTCGEGRPAHPVVVVREALTPKERVRVTT